MEAATRTREKDNVKRFMDRRDIRGYEELVKKPTESTE